MDHVKPLHLTSWVALVTPTDHPTSVRNRCVIEICVALFVLSLCPFNISASIGAFVIGRSQISPFFSKQEGCAHLTSIYGTLVRL